jgi:hypothetical protein
MEFRPNIFWYYTDLLMVNFFLDHFESIVGIKTKNLLKFQEKKVALAAKNKNQTNNLQNIKNEQIN